MKIFFRIFLIIFSLTLFTCKQDKPSIHNRPAVLTPQLSDSVLLHQADSLYDLADKITDLKKSDSALHLHKKALDIREKFLTNDIRLLNSNYKVGLLYWLDNKFNIADNHLEKARTISETISTPDSTLFDVYRHLASCKIEAKDFPTALSLSQHLLSLIQKREPENISEIVITYRQIASIYYNSNQADRAVENWLNAIKIVPQKNHELLGSLYFNLSIVYGRLNRYEESLIYINKAIQQDLISAGPESKSIADRYMGKAFALLNMNKTDSSNYFLHKTLRIRKKVFGEKHSYMYGIKRGIGDFYSKVNQFDSSLYYHHQSLISLIRSFNDPNLFENPIPEQDELTVDLVSGLCKKASVAVKLYERDSARTELLDLALKTYLRADSIFAAYRKNILHDDPVLQQMQFSEIPYSKALGIALKLFNQKKSANYFEKAFRLMESSRAIVLLNAMKRASAFGSTVVSDSLLNKENKLIQLRAELRQELNKPNLTQPVRDSLREELLHAHDHELALQDELKSANPNYFSLKYEKPLTVDDVQTLLSDRNSVYLEYMWSDSTIYALMIGDKTVRASSIQLTKKYIDAFSGFINELRGDPESATTKPHYKNFYNSSSFLYNALLKDFLTGIDPSAHLIISADGPLATIPFEALITHLPETGEVNYKLPYLVLDHPISYAYSAGVLSKQFAHKRDGKKLLAFGYAGSSSRGATRSMLSDLPGTEKEILAIKDIMKNHVNQYKLQGEASESSFKHQVSDFDIIHLAIHGEADTLDALNSRLIFRKDTDHEEDGSLYAHELYSLNLNKLDLAVLSACESGVGKQQTGEGVMSIARGFAYAGCPSLVISLWKIDDQTSAQVMKEFYTHLSNGEALDVSLAKAKTEYIKSTNEFNSHPFYWAAFLQVGEVKELDIKKPNWWGWVLGGLALGTVIFFIVPGISRSQKSTK